MRLLIVLLLLGIVASLAIALRYMLRRGDGSRQMLAALWLRVGLSVLLFLLLLLAWSTGLIEPHGLADQ